MSDEPEFYMVALYVSDKAYGGPEEGGWWYNVGEVSSLIPPVICYSREEALEASKKMELQIVEKELNSGKYPPSSVCCDGWYQAEVHEGFAPTHYPKERPHYE